MEEIKLPYNLDLESRPFQGEILRDSRRNKVLVIPRRHGKTTLAIAKLIMEAIINPNSIYHYVFPYYKQAKEAVWIAPDMINKLVPPVAIAKKNEQSLILFFHNGSQIHIKGADNPDSLRSLDCQGVIFDEPAQIKAAIFDEIYYPILAANGGWSWYVGTPKGKNAFYQKFITCRKDELNWQVVHLKASTAGLFTTEQLAKIRSEMTQKAFSQEMECEFLDDGGSLFHRVRENIADTLCNPEVNKQYLMGVDLAKYSDFTDISVLDRHEHKIVYRESFNQIDWNLQKAKIESIARRYNNAKIRIDSTGVGDPITEDLTRTGLTVEPYRFNATSKKQLIENLVIIMEEGKVKIPNDPNLIDQLEAFEATISDKSNNVSYNAPSGLHDDAVISLALACWNLGPKMNINSEGKKFNFKVSYDKFGRPSV
jgi:glycerophosphoryl diester phosphodiesterase